MLKSLFFGSLVLLGQPATISSKFTVLYEGLEVGSAEATSKLLETGGKQTVLTMNLKSRGMESRVRQESILDSLGQPTRMILEVVADKSKRQHITATFDANGANVTINLDGKLTQKQVPLEKDAPRDNASEYWFIKTQPKVGEKVAYYAFETSNQTWNLKSRVYEGVKEVQVGSQLIKGNVVRGNDDSLSVFDDKGKLLGLSQKSLAMVAINKS